MELRVFNKTLFFNDCRYHVIQSANGGVLPWFQAYFLPCFVGVGLLGNAIILVTLNAAVNKQTMKPSLFLSAKAVADFLGGIFAVLFNLNVYSGIADNDTYDRIYYHHLQRPVFAIMNFLLMSSTWYAVAVTFERMFAIRWPLKARNILTTRRIRKAIVLIAIFSVLLTFYPLIVLTNVTHVDCMRPWRRVYATVGPLSREQPTLWYYGFVSRLVHNILATIVPVILLTVFNSVLVWHLRQHRRSMARFGSAGYSVQDASEELRISFVVFTITAATTVFLLPSAYIVFYDAVYRSVKPKWYKYFVHVANLMVFCDKVLDFFLYCFVSSHFRSQLMAACKSQGIDLRRISTRSQDLIVLNNLKRCSKETVKSRVSVAV